MMWNLLVGVLLTDAPIVLFDGNPGYPTMERLWDLAEQTRMTCFGTSAAFIAASMKAGVHPRQGRDLRRLRSVGSTGSPLSPRASAGCTTRSDATHGCSRPPAGPTCAPRLSVACRRCRCAGGAPGALARRGAGGVGRRWQRGRRSGRRVGPDRADALDADLLLGRSVGRAVSRQLLCDLPGCLAPRRLGRDHGRGAAP